MGGKKMIILSKARRAAAGQQYALIVGLIAVVALVAVTRMGSGVGSLMSRTSNALGASVNGVSGSSGGGGGASPPPPPGPPPGINYVRRTDLAGQRLQVSNDGISWSPSGSSEALTIDSSSMAWIGDRFAGYAPYASKVFYSSLDGISFTFNQQSALSTGGNLIDFNFNGAQIITVGGSTIVQSPDSGVSWTNVTPGGLPYMSGVAFGNSRWIAVGNGGAIWSSTSGTSGWAAITSPVSGLIRRVRWQGGQFIAVGDGGMILTSPTGATGTFVSRTSGTSSILWYSAYGNGTYVAAGGAGTIRYSTDNGVTWQTAVTAMPNVFINNVIFADGRFRIIGEQSLAADSADGNVWTIRQSGGSVNYINIASKLP